jgi:two-component system NtrC family response regulator
MKAPANAAAKPKLLIVEDDPGLCSQYRWAFPDCEVLFAHERTTALTMIAREHPPVAIMDLGLPPDPDGVSEGFATLEAGLRQAPDMKVIVATSHGDRSHALRAIAAGAYDFCDKPVEIEVLRAVVARTQKVHSLEVENRRLLAAPAESRIKGIVTRSDVMLKLCGTIERLATTNVTVLLTGESGTGKEALARALHDLGPRSAQPFVALNCGAIPENLLESELFGHERGAFTGAVARSIGKIETAHRGTLFLDEIGDLPLPLQVKLLRFLQEQTIERIGGRQTIAVDVRVVSATNQPLETRITEGLFRADLFYRLNPVTVRIPPLRERPGDALLLARYFLNRFNGEFARSLRGFTEAAVAAISGHDWPGNVRELENRLKRGVVMADGKLIDAGDLELAPSAHEAMALDLRAARLRAEFDVLQKALARTQGGLSATAKLLGVSRPTLYTLLATHGLAAQEGKPGAPDDSDGAEKPEGETMPSLDGPFFRSRG